MRFEVPAAQRENHAHIVVPRGTSPICLFFFTSIPRKEATFNRLRIAAQ